MTFKVVQVGRERDVDIERSEKRYIEFAREKISQREREG